MFGYDNYYDYATENVYGRDYTAEDLQQYYEYVKYYIAPDIANIINAYRSTAGSLGSNADLYSSFSNGKFDSMEDNYVMMYLESLGDTNMGIAMRDVFESENCVFADNKNSHPTAFQTWLYESDKPFCLFGSNGQSSTTIIHEIGHYYAAYTNDDIDDYDLCETHSQSNEFLFMNYCSAKLPKNVFRASMLYQLVNTCGTITLASIVDQFEQRVYSLSEEELEAMTVEDFDAIMEEIKSYSEYKGVIDNFIDPCEYWKRVAVSSPVYYISYSVSAVASLNIYAMALEDTDAAIAAYRALVETDGIDEMGYVEALTVAGVANPFEEQSHRKIANLIDKFIKD
jgi:oligoendopeptidase F